MYEVQNIRTTLHMLQRRAERRAERERGQEQAQVSECSVCHRRTDNAATRCGLHPQEGV